MTWATIQTFITTKLAPAFGAIVSALPGLVSSNAADVQAAITAINKVLSDLQSDFATLISAVKTAG